MQGCFNHRRPFSVRPSRRRPLSVRLVGSGRRRRRPLSVRPIVVIVRPLCVLLLCRPPVLGVLEFSCVSYLISRILYSHSHNLLLSYLVSYTRRGV